MALSFIAIFLLTGVAQAADHVGMDPMDEIKAKFDTVGAGLCQDADGGQGSGEEEPVVEPGKECCPMGDDICMRRCGAIPWCLGFSDKGIDCTYYKVEIESADGSGDGTCYKKKPPPGKETTSPATQAVLGAFTLVGVLSSFMI